uniref:Polyprotein n=1 Tax=Cajanus cajan TaxID=3821 RepID=A0A151RSJ9_CAJCA|nr:polyprotein [Cajanus cajan]
MSDLQTDNPRPSITHSSQINLTIPKSCKQTLSDKLENLIEYSRVPEDAQIESALPPLVQDHYYDLPTEAQFNENALMVISNSEDQVPTIVQIPKQISRGDLELLIPREWISNYESYKNGQNPVVATEYSYQRLRDGSVKTIFKKKDPIKASTSNVVFSTMMISLGERETTVPIYSFMWDIAPEMCDSDCDCWMDQGHDSEDDSDSDDSDSDRKDRYYSDEWFLEAPYRIFPHEDEEISMERNKYRWTLDAKSLWVMHGSSAPLLQKLSLKLLVQPSSSSCCERNWSTYSFIHSLKRNRLNPKRAEDLVYVHTNLRLLSKKSEEYICNGVLENEKIESFVITKFECQEHRWLRNLYKLHKWCTGLNKGIFSANILSTQRRVQTMFYLAYQMQP